MCRRSIILLGPESVEGTGGCKIEQSENSSGHAASKEALEFSTWDDSPELSASEARLAAPKQHSGEPSSHEGGSGRCVSASTPTPTPHTLLRFTGGDGLDLLP